MVRRNKKHEDRIHERWKIDQFLCVYDEDTSSFIGRIEDLSVDGMCVVSSESIPIGNIVKLAMEVILEDSSIETVLLRCRSLWIRVADDDHFKIGFRFLGIPPHVVKKIQHILARQAPPGAA